MAGYETLLAIFRFFVMPEKKIVAGQIVLVTGAGHGIGKELSLQLSRLGAHVVCCDINEEWNNATVEQIKGEAGVACGYRCDISDRDCVKKIMQQVRKDVGDIDILINNAGIMPCKPFLQHSPEELERLFGINVFGHFWTLQEWLPVFMTRGTGHIVALSSLAGIIGTSNLVPYSATKFAIKGLMEGLTEELRFDNKYLGIKLTTVHPFVVNTGLAQKPRVRFPPLTPITSTERAAEIIIDGLRREEYHVAIPRKDFYLFKILSILPRRVQHLVIDFLDAEVEQHEE